jgi:hypothetical protein
MDKSAWGAGPWQDEPDRLEWRDAATGLVCLITRNPFMGNLCGYVGVPQSHPLAGREYHELENIHAHGGVNYAAPCEGNVCHVPQPGEEDVYWFGFDCAHGYDLAPGMAAIMPEDMRRTMDTPYRDFAYVQDQCARLAAQLAAAQ